MSSWLAALGPCASPKSKAKERQRAGGSLERPIDVVALKRHGSLTEIRNNRKITGHSRSFREKIANTFEGSLRKAKKVGSLEAVPTSASASYNSPDTNMNLATSLSPKHHGGSPCSSGEKDSQQEQDKFWTNFYNTLPRNRQKGDRPKDLSLQNLPVTEGEGDIPASPQNETMGSISPSQKDGQWQVYATSPRTKRKNKTLERMNSAPSTRKSPMRNYDTEVRPVADGVSSQQQLDQTEVFENMANAGFVVMPRSVSLQEEYWMPTTKGVSRVELRKVTPSPDRILIGHPPLGSPVQLQGHVWVKTKDGSHIELRPVERPPREANAPSPSESQKTDISSISYTTAASSLSNLDTANASGGDGYPPDHPTHPAPDPQYLGPYMSPEEYQANIFDLIHSLNTKSPPNPGSPAEVKPGTVVTNVDTEDPDKSFHSEQFIVLASAAENDEAPKSPTVTDDYVNR